MQLRPHANPPLLWRPVVALMPLCATLLTLAHPALAQDEAPAASTSEAARPALPDFPIESPATPLLTPSSRLDLGAFTDINLNVPTDLEGVNVGIGQVVVHARAHLGSGFSTFGEFTLNSPSWDVRVERLIFDWEPSDAFKLSVGRMHSPVTWWNQNFHHGVWLQTTATRPQMISFNRGGTGHSHGAALLESHFKGARISGLLPFLDRAGLRYLAGVASGGDDSGVRDGVTVPYAFMTFANLALEPPDVPFLRVGITGNYVVDYPLPNQKKGARTLETGAHIAYTSDRPELIVEGVMTTDHVAESKRSSLSNEQTTSSLPTDMSGTHMSGGHETTSTGMSTSTMQRAVPAGSYQSGALYAQVAWRIARGKERFKPYARYEYTTLQHPDHGSKDPEVWHIVMAGLRVDLTNRIALKTEGVRYTDTDTNVLNVQLSAAW